MNWSKNKSITLSQICIIVFAVILAAIDILYLPFAFTYEYFEEIYLSSAVALSASLYVLSALAWVLLFSLWNLLKNMKKEAVFVTDNVRLLRRISWCCAGAAIVSIITGFFGLPLVFTVIAIPAAFMMLIVRIIKNVFEQAVDMKSELDLTI